MTYPAAREGFERVAAVDPHCAMAHWGISMTLFQAMWPTRPGREELRKGWEAVRTAEELQPPSERERLFVEAAAAFFRDPDSTDYWGRVRRWEQAMAKVYTAFPHDPEAAAFYALAHLATAPPERVSREHADHAAAILLDIYRRKPSCGLPGGTGPRAWARSSRPAPPPRGSEYWRRSPRKRARTSSRATSASSGWVRAWLAFAEQDRALSVTLMREAAELEASTPKHAVTPGATLPAHELLGDLFLAQGQPAEALLAYRQSLGLYPGRFNSVAGAARAARASGDEPSARSFYRQLLDAADEATTRPAIDEARKFVSGAR